MRLTRRSVLAAGTGVATASSLAGCLDDVLGEQPAGEGVQASFFLLHDFAQRVAGEDADVESVVPFGQHGHGWHPSGQVQRDVHRSALFVYMGEGFQPWADDIVRSLEEDGAETHVVAAREGVDLIEWNGNHDQHDDGHDHDEDGDDGQDHDEDDGHDHDEDVRGGPHFWLDPLRAQGAVENVRDGLIEVDEGNAEDYEDRAGTYLDDLERLDREFDDRLSNAEKDAVLVAGHNAFRYLGTRYDFEVHAISGLSPDDEPSTADIREAQAVIEEHDMEYVLAPELESDRAATRLVEATDASEALPISALSGLTDEWRETDWGYREIMENVNLPSLAKALAAE